MKTSTYTAPDDTDNGLFVYLKSDPEKRVFYFHMNANGISFDAVTDHDRRLSAPVARYDVGPPHAFKNGDVSAMPEPNPELERFVNRGIWRHIPLFTILGIWSCVMVVLQFMVLLLLTFEPRIENGESVGIGFVDSNNIIRFISDSIDDHRGFGTLMLLAFSGSFALLACMIVPHVAEDVLYLLIGAAGAGGMMVVVFHDKWQTEHLVGAGIFIMAGVLSHLFVACTSPVMRHVIRDSVMFCSIAATGAAFCAFYIIADTKTDATAISLSRVHYALHNATSTLPAHHARHSARYEHRILWCIAAISEYILYVSIVFLNSLIPQRISEHVSYHVSKALPLMLKDHLETAKRE